MDKNRIANTLEEIARELKDETSPKKSQMGEIVVPYSDKDMNTEDWDDATKIVYRPPFKGVKIQFPEGKHDFSCHECDGEYGPWIVKKFWKHDYASLSDSPAINLGVSRVRRCYDCGNVFFNCYSMGQVSIEVDEKSGHLSLDSTL